MKKLLFILFSFAGINGFGQLIPSTVGQEYLFCVGDSFEYSYSESEAMANCGITATRLNVITAYSVSGDTITYTYTSLSSSDHAPCPNYFPPYGILFDSTQVTQKVTHPDSGIFGPATGAGGGSCQGFSSSQCYDSVYLSNSGILIGKKLNEYNVNALSSVDNIWSDSLGMVYSNIFEEGYSTRYITSLIFYHKVCTGETRGTFRAFNDYSLYAGVNNIGREIKISISPNPASNNFEVSIAGVSELADGKAKLSVTNLLGQQMYSQNIVKDKTDVACSFWASGLYIWMVERDGTIIKGGKVVVE